MKKVKYKSRKEKRDLKIYVKILGHKKCPDKKIIKTKRSGTPKLYRADQVKINF